MIYKKILLCFSLFVLHSQTFAALEDAQLNVWTNEAIVATYTYNYKDFLEQQKGIAKYFTSKGWIAYSKAFTDSKLLEAIQKNDYYVSAVATLPPDIKLIRDNYWQAVMPLLVVYQNPQYQQKQTLEVTIEFTAAPAGQGVRGYAITSLQSKVVKPACKCPT